MSSKSLLGILLLLTIAHAKIAFASNHVPASAPNTLDKSTIPTPVYIWQAPVAQGNKTPQNPISPLSCISRSRSLASLNSEYEEEIDDTDSSSHLLALSLSQLLLFRELPHVQSMEKLVLFDVPSTPETHSSKNPDTSSMISLQTPIPLRTNIATTMKGRFTIINSEWTPSPAPITNPAECTTPQSPLSYSSTKQTQYKNLQSCAAAARSTDLMQTAETVLSGPIRKKTWPSS